MCPFSPRCLIFSAATPPVLPTVKMRNFFKICYYRKTLYTNQSCYWVHVLYNFNSFNCWKWYYWIKSWFLFFKGQSWLIFIEKSTQRGSNDESVIIYSLSSLKRICHIKNKVSGDESYLIYMLSHWDCLHITDLGDFESIALENPCRKFKSSDSGFPADVKISFDNQSDRDLAWSKLECLWVFS